MHPCCRECEPFSRLPDPAWQPNDTLQELEWVNANDDREVSIQPAEVQYIASLRSLKTLVLRKFFNWADLKAWRALPLQSLTLEECNNMELDFLVPGALTSLTELYIEGKVSEDGPGLPVKYNARDPALKHRFEEAAEVLRGLPNLSRLIGDSALIRMVQKSKLQGCNFSYQR